MAEESSNVLHDLSIELEDSGELVKVLCRGFVDAALAADPGPRTPILLAAVDADLLDDAQKARLIEAWERQIAWTSAMQHHVVASLCGEEAEHDRTAVGMELATALGLGDFAVQRRMTR